MSLEAQTQTIERGDTVSYWDYECTVIGTGAGPDGEVRYRVGTMNKMVTAIFDGVKHSEISLIAKKKPKIRRDAVIPSAVH